MGKRISQLYVSITIPGMTYEEIYNGHGSQKKADNSWERYMNSDDPTRERYEYSVDYLYGDVLDVGAGDGFGAYLMLKNKRIKTITCVEIQDKAIERMRKNVPGVRIVKSTAESMNLGLFDSVHCGHTLEHVEDIDGALEGIKRHARGRVVISVPINGGISHTHLREFKSIEEVNEIIGQYFIIEGYRIFDKGDGVSSIVIIAQ